MTEGVVKSIYLRLRWAYIVLFVTAVSLLLGGCVDTENLSYDTLSNHQKLTEIEGKKVALLAFDYEPRLLLSGDAIDASIAEPILGYHKERFITEFSKIFSIEDVTELDVISGKEFDFNDQNELQQLIRQLDVEGAILVRSAYGYQFSDSIFEQISDQLLDPVVPDDAQSLVNFLDDPSNIEFYYFASESKIVDQDGAVIWHFYGKVPQSPNIFKQTSKETLTAFWNRFAGLDPNSQEMVGRMAPITDLYLAYNLWLLETDLNNSADKNFFTDYPDREDSFTLYPATDETHVPFVTDKPEENPGGVAYSNFVVELWNVARNGSWNQFGQWQIAWAALKLFGIGILGAAIIVGIQSLVGEESGCGQALLIPALAVSLVWLIALWYILKAVF